MRRRSILGAVLGLFALGASGCLARTLPIPPPGATVTTTTCVEACGDGVEVRIEGDARPGALVVAVNVSRRFADGRAYSASALASGTSDPDGGADAGTPSGHYAIFLGAIPDGANPPVISHHGDAIDVYQLVRTSDGTFEQSETVRLTVP